MHTSASVAKTVCLVAGVSLLALTPNLPPAAVAASQPAGVMPAAGARLISETQFDNTIIGIFGPDFASSTSFAPVRRDGGLIAVGSSSAVITPGAFDRLENMARKIAAKAVQPAYRDLVMPCQPAAANAADPACAKKFVSSVGRLLFRRPVSDAELAIHVGIANSAAEAKQDFYAGISNALTSLLVSPEFLFVRENVVQRPQGEAKLTGYSKATRLSILLWDAYPDSDLLTAAEKGALDTPRGLKSQVDRMIASPRVAGSVRTFFADMLQFDQFSTLSKDPQIYPAFTGKVTADASEQALRLLVDHLITNDLDYRDLFTTRKVFLTNDLGMIYRIPITKPDQWVAYTLPEDSPRTGFLTSVGFLALYSHPGRSSPTRRGRALRELLLCQTVPNPPANVDFSQFEDPKQKLTTARERLAAHAVNPVCAGCHKITDPIGLSLEAFDGAAQFRTEDGGAKIDTSGELSGVKFSDAKGLGEALRNNPALTSCLVSRVSAYSLGRAMTVKDAEWLDYLKAGFANDGYRFRSLLKVIATSQAFYTVPNMAPAP